MIEVYRLYMKDSLIPRLETHRTACIKLVSNMIANGGEGAASIAVDLQQCNDSLRKVKVNLAMINDTAAYACMPFLHKESYLHVVTWQSVGLTDSIGRVYCEQLVIDKENKAKK